MRLPRCVRLGMCRLIAYVGRPISPTHLVFDGTHSLDEQAWAPRQQLSGGLNVDGYGSVLYADGRRARIAEPRPLWHDEDLHGTLAATTSDCVMAAVSGATGAGAVPRTLLHRSYTIDGDGRSSRIRGA